MVVDNTAILILSALHVVTLLTALLTTLVNNSAKLILPGLPEQVDLYTPENAA